MQLTILHDMSAESRDVAWVTVPDLIGMTVPDARRTGHDSGVVVTSANVDWPPLGALTWPGTWMVIAQRPGAGAHVERWSRVIIEFRKVPGDDDGD
jgi:beta-lactam-binding protein with PASTA domain